MNEAFTRRGSAPAKGIGPSGRDDPLAELARMVGGEDPFADLFNDARRTPAAPDSAHEPATSQLRGPYQDHDGTPEEDDPYGYDEQNRKYAAFAQATSRHRNYDDTRYDEDGQADEAAPFVDEQTALSAEPEYASYAQQTTRRPLASMVGAAALICVAVVGGGVAYAWKSGVFDRMTLGSGGPPPVIMASDQPTKIMPDAPAAPDSSAPTKEIFEKGSKTASTKPDTVVPREEQPMALADNAAVTDDALDPDLATASASASPTDDQAAIDASIDGGSTPSVGRATIDPASIEPRRVKTVKVMADGTIVRGDAPLTREASLTVQPPIAEAPPVSSREMPAPDPSMLPTTVPAGIPSLSGSRHSVEMQDQPTEEAPAATAEADPLGASRSVAEAPPAPVAAPAMPPSRPRNIPVETASVAEAVVAPAKPAPVKPVPAKPMEVASAEPVQVASSAEGYVVQVSSQKSQADAAASFQAFQRKYSSIVGSLKPSIKKAEVADKGTFYRVRVGSWSSRDGATAFCVKLKAAGGDCVVAKN